MILSGLMPVKAGAVFVVIVLKYILQPFTEKSIEIVVFCLHVLPESITDQDGLIAGSSVVCFTGQRAAVRSRPGSSSSRSAPARPAHSSGHPLSLGPGSRLRHHLLRITLLQSLSSMTSREVRKCSCRWSI